jgi:restriction system protein
MAEFWMVRAGEGGYLSDDFQRASCIGVGFHTVGTFEHITSLEEMRALIRKTYPDSTPTQVVISAGVAFKFRHTIKNGDRVISYDPSRREYLVGTVAGDYEYGRGHIPDYQHTRRVQWQGRVSRDELSASTRNVLGATLTIFQPGAEVLDDVERALRGGSPLNDDSATVAPESDFQVIWRDTVGRSHEFIKDRILKLSPDEMELLVASLLRAMGYKARVTQKGADRGRDVLASPDGLGFQDPRIVAEVKHRPNETIGSEKIRSFLGGLREGDRGLYVSTGGYSREAKYEADRSGIPVTLVDLDDLARLVVDHYERFDAEGRNLMPLARIYWPLA